MALEVTIFFITANSVRSYLSPFFPSFLGSAIDSTPEKTTPAVEPAKPQNPFDSAKMRLAVGLGKALMGGFRFDHPGLLLGSTIGPFV